jgi:hypothetical protein
MELECSNGVFMNGKNDILDLEDYYIFPLLKSSDLNKKFINSTRKFVILTQKFVGQETKTIKIKAPNTYKYLTENIDKFRARKSSIYKNKPDFSIFGIGDYTFKPYKVAISGLYKKYYFSFIFPSGNKPIVLDDTCYFLGFDDQNTAVFTQFLLNCEENIEFLKSITFLDSKRTFTKDVLQRIDIFQLSNSVNPLHVELFIRNLNSKIKLTMKDWYQFKEKH